MFFVYQELILNDDKRWDSKNYMKKDFLEYTGAKRILAIII